MALTGASGRGLSHHELCFGCGQQNLFGLQLEVEEREDGGVAGRFFVKQDHQGPPGYAHGGVMAAALDEAMSLLVHARGKLAYTARLELDVKAPAPVGEFVEIRGALLAQEDRKVEVAATATSEGVEVAAARAVFVVQS